MKRAEENTRGLVVALALAVWTGACTGKIAGDVGGAGGAAGAGGGGAGSPGGAGALGAAGAGGGGAVADGWPSFTPTTSFGLRRLTTEQYANTVKTLLGVSTAGMPAIEKVSPAAGFSAIGASTASVSSAGVAAFEDAARFLAHAAMDAGGTTQGQRARLVPCAPTGPTDSACFGKFVTAFGARAFRRPLTADEVSRYTAATTAAATAAGDPWAGLEAITSAFLQSPSFLYLTEVGAPDPQNAGRFMYTGAEMASRLSYFLTNDMPDDTLLAAASSGALATAAGVQAQAARLLATQAARDTVGAFFRTLLSLDNLDALTRPTQLFPKYTATLGPAMKQETALVLDDLVFGKDGDYRRLFDSTETFVNAELAGLYGVPAPPGAGFSRVTLPAASHRVGLLGHAGVLAARDHADGTSPTRRGLFVLTKLLCENVPLAPPAGLQIPPPPTGLLTQRQKLDQHASNAACASCHKITDPVGLSLEHFDAMGVWRDDDHGLAIDDAGVLDGKTYQGEAGLGAALRDHPALGPCLIQSLYGVGVGHLATEFDRAPFAALAQSFAANGARVKALLAAIVASDGFRYLPKPTGM
jgi:hypothetical protein